MGKVSIHKIRLIRNLFNLALSISKGGASKASLASLCQCLTTLWVKNISLKYYLNLLWFSLTPFHLFFPVSSLMTSFHWLLLLKIMFLLVKLQWKLLEEQHYFTDILCQKEKCISLFSFFSDVIYFFRSIFSVIWIELFI